MDDAAIAPLSDTRFVPFTVSHMAAILPFARSPLPAAALGFGAMAPDLFYFVRIGVPRDLSHSLVGALTVDLAVALLAFALWRLFIKAPTLDYSPRWLRERLTPELGWRDSLLGNRSVPAALALTAAAVFVGTLTHLAWDTFTHDGSLDDIFPVLAGTIGPVEIDEVIHAASSVIGAVILAVWTRRWVRRTAAVERPGTVSDVERRVVWILLSSLGIGSALVAWLIGLAQGYPPMNVHLWFLMVIFGAIIPAVVGVVFAGAWHLRARSRSLATR